MAMEMYDSTLRGLRALGCGVVAFMGGEPTVRDDFVEMVAKARRAGMVTHVSTNGRLLTSEYAEALCEAGIGMFNVSADTVNPDLESAKPLEAVKEVLDTLVELSSTYKTSVFVTQVVTTDTLGEIAPMAEYLGSRSISHNIAFATDANGRLVGYTTPEELEALDAAVDRIMDLKKRGYLSSTSRAYVEAVRRLAHTGTVDWNCRAGASSMQIMTDGRIELCSEGEALARDLGLNISDVTPARWKSARSESRDSVRACSERCISCCLFETSRLATHPWESLSSMT
jgi:MoaA/NifB/PqqE/SkfB family radical SAM enzyme